MKGINQPMDFFERLYKQYKQKKLGIIIISITELGWNGLHIQNAFK